MANEDKITIDIFKVVAKAVAESSNLPIMLHHLSQLLTAALEIKGCSIFVLNLEEEELELLASFGLSTAFLGKGPIRADQSVGCTLRGEPVIINDISSSKQLQYPKQTKKEGIAAIVCMPVFFLQEVVGVLRLYHDDIWHISERDVESLLILGESIGMAMMFARLLDTVGDVQTVMSELPPELARLNRED